MVPPDAGKGVAAEPDVLAVGAGPCAVAAERAFAPSVAFVAGALFQLLLLRLAGLLFGWRLMVLVLFLLELLVLLLLLLA